MAVSFSLLIFVTHSFIPIHTHPTPAVEYYRRAAKLVPDIEFQAYRMQLRSQPQSHAAGKTDCSPSATTLTGTAAAAAASAADRTSTDEDLDTVFLKQNPVIEPARHVAPGRHISALPREVLLKILVDAVLPLGDLQTLGRVACVCRYFYLLVRDAHLWQRCAVALQIASQANGPQPYPSWRELCLLKPRVLAHGIYISRVSYTRPGEQGMDEHYRPFHVVQYFRCLRFFPGGKAMHVMSSEQPQTVRWWATVWEDGSWRRCYTGDFCFRLSTASNRRPVC